MQHRIVGRSEQRVMPWKNGRGSTTELCTDAALAGDAWTWRLSIADVPEAGPFSQFAGIDRWIACVQGQGMRVQVDGAWRTVPTRGDALAFAGEAASAGEPMGADVRDANLMVRRDVWRAHMSVRRAGDRHAAVVAGEPGHVAVVHAFDSPVRASCGECAIGLARGETAILSGLPASGGWIELSGEAEVVVIGVLRENRRSR